MDLTQIFTKVYRSLPSANADGTDAFLRGGKYMELVTKNIGNSKTAIAEEGQYFLATNPTPGTGIAGPINATYDVTKSWFMLVNGDTTGGKSVILDYIKVIPTVAPASATSFEVSIQMDSTNRYTSGGLSLTPKNVNMGSTTAPISTFYYASTTVLTTATASANARIVGRTTLRASIPVVKDECYLRFGTDVANSYASTVGGTTCTVAPVVVGPGGSAIINIWFPSNAVTGMSYEFEVGFYER